MVPNTKMLATKYLRRTYLCLAVFFAIAGYVCGYLRRDLVLASWSAELLAFVNVLLYSAAGSIVFAVVILQAWKQYEQAHVNESVFDALFGVLVPKELVQTAQHKLLRAPLVRTDQTLTFHFSEMQDGRICLSQSQDSFLQNLTDKPVVNNRVMPGIRNIGGAEHIVMDANYTGEHDEEVECSSNGISITIPALTTIREAITIITKFEHPGRAHSHHASHHAVLNTRLSVTYPRGYELSIEPLFSNKLVEIYSPASNQGNAYELQQKYKLEGALLPYQGFSYALDRVENV